MIPAIAPPPRTPSNPPLSLRALCVRDGWAVLGLAAATIGVQLGVYAAGLAAGAGVRDATVAALAAATVWVALTAPIAAAGAVDGWGAVLRGGTVADASAVMLLVLWQLAKNAAGQTYVTVLAAAQIYCTFAVMALASIAAVRCAKRPAGRYTIALIVSALWMATLTSPMWIGGLVLAVPPQARQTVVAWAVLGNPLYSVLSAAAERTAFIWHQWGVLYRRITVIGDYAPPPVAWYAAVWRYGLLAAVLGTIAVLRGRGGKSIGPDGPADRPAAPRSDGRPGLDG